MTANCRPAFGQGFLPSPGSGSPSQIVLTMSAGARPFFRSCSALGPVADVDDRLRRDHADFGLSPEDAVADREHPRLHGPADLAGRRVVAEDREGGDRIGQALLLARQGSRDGEAREREHDEEDSTTSSRCSPADCFRGRLSTAERYRQGTKRSIHWMRIRSL